MIISMEDYISHHPLFERWKTLRKRNVLCAEWNRDFRVFLKGVGERPDGFKKLVRDDMSKPYGPGNARWGKTPTREETLAYYKAWNRANPNYRHRKHVAETYGLRDGGYDEMFAAQDGCCAICGRTQNQATGKRGRPQRLAVDHDHGTDRVRSLLCKPCNTGLGAFGDDPSRLFAAIQYLAKWGKVAKVS